MRRGTFLTVNGNGCGDCMLQVNPTTGEAGAPTPDYTEFETFALVHRRP